MTEVELSIVGDSCITVGATSVTPAASHLFALLLLLTAHGERRLSRRDVQELLFSGDVRDGSALHSLRQLIYRLRRLGVALDETPSGMGLQGVGDGDSLKKLLALSPEARAALPEQALRVLPGYSPRLPSCFLDWLDTFRDSVALRIRELLRADLRALRDAHLWPLVSTLAATLEQLDPNASDLGMVRAEALALMGQRSQALDVLETLIRERPDLPAPIRDDAVRLRNRIAKTGDAPRESTLRGRDECLAFLRREWELSATGGARLCTLIGAPGMGKTRVATEFARGVALRQGKVLEYRCDAHTRAQPLALFSAILPVLRQMRGSLGVSPRHVDLLDRLQFPAHPAHAEASDTIADFMRAEYQRALVDLLEAVTAEQRLLVVVDDAQFLDSSSLVFLTHVSNSVNSAALLVVTCRRTGIGAGTHGAVGERSASHLLGPLKHEDASLIIQELDTQRVLDSADITRRVTQAGGNPFFLRAVALHRADSSGSSVDIRSLAVGLYSQLTTEAKTVLETSLLLKRNATIDRVRAVAAVADDMLLRGFRSLEESDLIRMAGPVVLGPHDLLHEELLQLIPSSVCALLQRRIAATLAADCIEEQFAPELAWAAAQSWMSVGDHSAATALVLRCAEHAASLAEPGAAVDLLNRIDRASLPPSQHVDLCEALAAYSQRSGNPSLAATSLAEAVQIGKGASMPRTRVAQLEVEAIEADLKNGGDTKVALGALSEVLLDESARARSRIRAGLRLMVIADLDLDAVLAEETRSRLASISPDCDVGAVDADRATLVYHTTFGDPARASAIAIALLSQYPQPILTEAGLKARHFAAFAFYRMRDFPNAIPLCEANFFYFLERGIHDQALYAASVRTDIALEEGDFSGAYAWLSRGESVTRGRVAELLSPVSGHTANAGMLALMRGDYEAAEVLLREPLRQYSLVRASRFRATYLALSLRVRYRRGDMLPACDVEELTQLYQRGSRLGGQDAIVAVLWCAKVLRGDEKEASLLLQTYLLEHRREQHGVDWFLGHTTSADPAWQLPSIARQARYAL